MESSLKYFRKKKGLKQEDLCAKVGIAIGSYRNYERGLRMPTKAALDKLSEFYKVPGLVLLTEDKELADLYVRFSELDPQERKAVSNVMDAIISAKKRN